jgi:hypothetical protein
MASRALSSILCLVIATGVVSCAKRRQSWDSLIAQLRSSDDIAASIIGYAALPSKSFALYQTVIKRGDAGKFTELAQDEHPVVRCVGLWALAQTAGKKSVPVLRRHLSDRGMVRYQAFDMIAQMTVGEFAKELLRDANALELRSRTRMALLSEEESVELDLQILADDSMTAVHGEAASDLRPSTIRGQEILSLPTLRKCTPSLQDYQIVKAVGRLEQSERQKDLLLACLRTEALDHRAKLAAASALTRHADAASLQAIREEQDALNRIDGRPWANQFMEILNTRSAHEKSMKSVRAMGWREQEAAKHEVILALTSNHPVALDGLLNDPAPVAVRKHEEVRQTLAESLVAISKNLEDYAQVWSTYSNAADRLDLFVRGVRARRAWMSKEDVALHEEPLTEDECAEIEKNIRRFIDVPRIPRPTWPPPTRNGR